MSVSRANVLRVWGGLDIFYVLWYSLSSWKEGRVPYLADLSSVMGLGDQLGSFLVGMGLLSWGLQISIALSGVLFVCGYRPARYLGFAQIPFRVLFLYPSVSLLLVVAGYLPSLLVVAFVVGSEVLKAWSLWKRA
ncbi:hypothetical protein [Pseudomonas fluorescens]|uniref:hypothetical protein n=1 Tax=Pseudomonas fluorescens TaxID=294 RepID=UPI00116104C2|nr:hypothetical protein [Pseudomonas fluorescens]